MAFCSSSAERTLLGCCDNDELVLRDRLCLPSEQSPCNSWLSCQDLVSLLGCQIARPRNDNRRACLSAPGGGVSLGPKVVGERITIKRARENDRAARSGSMRTSMPTADPMSQACTRVSSVDNSTKSARVDWGRRSTNHAGAGSRRVSSTMAWAVVDRAARQVARGSSPARARHRYLDLATSHQGKLVGLVDDLFEY